LSRIALLSSDLDGTLAGDRGASRRFRRAWERLDPAQRPLLVYNSGRLVDDILAFTAEEGLPVADYVVGGVGTMLHGAAGGEAAAAFRRRLMQGWSREIAEARLAAHPRTSRQPERYQHDFKSSWYLRDAAPEELAAIEAELAEAGLAATLVYSSDRDLDILPRAADKGQALAFLCDHLGIDLAEVVVAGDSGNDGAMFALPHVRGILVGNAMAELVSAAPADRSHRAAAGHADGVLEGLAAFGLPIAPPG